MAIDKRAAGGALSKIAPEILEYNDRMKGSLDPQATNDALLGQRQQQRIGRESFSALTDKQRVKLFDEAWKAGQRLWSDDPDFDTNKIPQQARMQFDAYLEDAMSDTQSGLTSSPLNAAKVAIGKIKKEWVPVDDNMDSWEYKPPKTVISEEGDELLREEVENDPTIQEWIKANELDSERVRLVYGFDERAYGRAQHTWLPMYENDDGYLMPIPNTKEKVIPSARNKDGSIGFELKSETKAREFFDSEVKRIDEKYEAIQQIRATRSDAARNPRSRRARGGFRREEDIEAIREEREALEAGTIEPATGIREGQR
jgi:hypothetical protein